MTDDETQEEYETRLSGMGLGGLVDELLTLRLLDESQLSLKKAMRHRLKRNLVVEYLDQFGVSLSSPDVKTPAPNRPKRKTISSLGAFRGLGRDRS
jgi:hypothetical protein